MPPKSKKQSEAVVIHKSFANAATPAQIKRIMRMLGLERGEGGSTGGTSSEMVVAADAEGGMRQLAKFIGGLEKKGFFNPDYQLGARTSQKTRDRYEGLSKVREVLQQQATEAATGAADQGLRTGLQLALRGIGVDAGTAKTLTTALPSPVGLIQSARDAYRSFRGPSVSTEVARIEASSPRAIMPAQAEAKSVEPPPKGSVTSFRGDDEEEKADFPPPGGGQMVPSTGQPGGGQMVPASGEQSIVRSLRTMFPSNIMDARDMYARLMRITNGNPQDIISRLQAGRRGTQLALRNPNELVPIPSSVGNRPGQQSNFRSMTAEEQRAFAEIFKDEGALVKAPGTEVGMPNEGSWTPSMTDIVNRFTEGIKEQMARIRQFGSGDVEEKEEEGEQQERKEDEQQPGDIMGGDDDEDEPIPGAGGGGGGGAPLPGMNPQRGSRGTAKGLEISDAGQPKSTKADQIPEQYLNDKFKSEAELRKDFKYFFSNFGAILQPEMKFLRNIRRGDIEGLRQLHRRIVGKLKAGGTKDDKKGEKFGVVVDGEEYVRNVIANMMMDQRFKGLKPKGAMVDVQRPDGQDKDVLDAGTFEIKRAQGGELAFQREPIYSAIPDTQPKQVEEERRDPRRNRPVYRMAAAPTKRRDLVHTARRQVKANPFQRFTPTVQLKYLY